MANSHHDCRSHHLWGRRSITPSQLRLGASATIRAIRPLQRRLSAGRHYASSRVCIRETGTSFSNRGAISVVYIVHRRIYQGFCLHSLALRSTFHYGCCADCSSYLDLYRPAPPGSAPTRSAEYLASSLCPGWRTCGRTWFFGASRLSPRVTRLRDCRIFIVFASWVSPHEKLAGDLENSGLVCAWRSIKHSKWTSSVCSRTRTKTLRKWHLCVGSIRRRSGDDGKQTHPAARSLDSCGNFFYRLVPCQL